jgi:hypothetical protein
LKKYAFSIVNSLMNGCLGKILYNLDEAIILQGYLETLYLLVRFDIPDIRLEDILRAMKRLFEIDPVIAMKEIYFFSTHRGTLSLLQLGRLSDKPEAQSLANDILNFR